MPAVRTHKKKWIWRGELNSGDGVTNAAFCQLNYARMKLDLRTRIERVSGGYRPPALPLSYPRMICLRY